MNEIVKKENNDLAEITKEKLIRYLDFSGVEGLNEK